MSPVSKSAMPDWPPLNFWLAQHRGHRVARVEHMDRSFGARYFTLRCLDCDTHFVYDELAARKVHG